MDAELLRTHGVGTRTVGLLALVAASAFGLPSTASAASVVLLPRVVGNAGPEVRDEAFADARMVLQNDGWTVFTVDDVSTSLPARLSACGLDDDCAWELKELLHADVAIGLRVGTGHVEAVLVGLRGIGQVGREIYDEDNPLPFAVAESVRTAERAWSRGQVTASIGAPETPPPIPDPSITFWNSALNWMVGGLLVLGSAPLLGYGINSWARSGTCVAHLSGDTGPCTQRIVFQEGAAVFTTVGAFLLVGGLAMIILQPIKLAVATDGRSAFLRVSGTF